METVYSVFFRLLKLLYNCQFIHFEIGFCIDPKIDKIYFSKNLFKNPFRFYGLIKFCVHFFFTNTTVHFVIQSIAGLVFESA